MQLVRSMRVFLQRAGTAAAVAALTFLVSVAAAAAQDRRAEVVRIPFPQDEGSLTPYSFELGYPLVTLIYDTVMWRDAAGVPRPWLARSVTRSADGLRLRLRLRRGVRWHDGKRLTADDVAFTFRYVAAHPHPRFTPQLADVEKVTTPDASTVDIALSRPSLGFLDQPLADLPILPEHVWASLPSGRTVPSGLPVGSGPYRLTRHRRGARYTLRANGRYFRGRPTVRTVEVPIIRDAEQALRSLQQGRVDAIPASLPEDAVRRVREIGTRVDRGPLYLGSVLLLNLRRPPFDRPKVRRAVAAALDLEDIARRSGRTIPATRGYLHPASRWSSGEELQEYDEREAREVLSDPALPTIRVLAPDNDPQRLEAASEVVIALQRAGAQARREVMPPERLARAVGQDRATPTFEAAIWSSPPLTSFDPAFLDVVFGSDGRLNYSGYRSPAFDRLANQVASARTTAARQASIDRQLRLLSADLPVVPLFFPEGAFAYRPGAHAGWTYVKGSGILDKRSFLPGERAASRSAPGAGDGPEGSSSSGIGPLGIAGLALLALAAGAGATFLWRRRA
jgi:peptide/nickel transport system substrate-binding protein